MSLKNNNKFLRTFERLVHLFHDCIDDVSEYVSGTVHSTIGATIQLEYLEELWQRVKHSYEQAMISSEEPFSDESNKRAKCRNIFNNYRKSFLNSKTQLLDLIKQPKDAKISNNNKSNNNENNNDVYNNKNKKSNGSWTFHSEGTAVNMAQQRKLNCKNHQLPKRPPFRNMEITKQITSVDKNKKRNNCPAASHTKCNTKFNSLLHRGTKKNSCSESKPTTNTAMHAETSSPDQASDQHQDQETVAHLTKAGKNVVLPTSLVAVRVIGVNHQALGLHQGSQSSDIAEKVQKPLVFTTEPAQAIPSVAQNAGIHQKDTHVPYILSSSHYLESAKTAQKQLLQVQKSAGFPLRQMATKNAELLDETPVQNRFHKKLLEFKDATGIKTIGFNCNIVLARPKNPPDKSQTKIFCGGRVASDCDFNPRWRVISYLTSTSSTIFLYLRFASLFQVGNTSTVRRARVLCCQPGITFVPGRMSTPYLRPLTRPLRRP